MPAVFAGVGAFVAGALGLGGVSALAVGAVVNVGLSLGLSYGVNALFGSGRQSQVRGVETSATITGAQPRRIPFGVVASAGRMAYQNSYGNSRKFLQLVYLLADWQCDGLQAVWIDGVRKTLTPVSIPGGNTEHARFTVQDFGGDFVIRFFDGRFDQSADAELIANDNPDGRWTTADRLRGICYVSLTLSYDEDKFSGGIPECLFEFRGARLYDWRKDSTAGGSGSHRWDNPSTWEWSDNPAVCDYNYRRGFYRAGQLLVGMGANAADLITNQYTAAANICDETLTEGGQSVRRYRVSAIATADQEHRVICGVFADACAGFSYERAGQFAIVAGAAQTTVAALTTADLVRGAPVVLSAKRSRDQLMNAAFGTFLDASQGFEEVSFDPIIVPGWETEDGERRGRSFDFPYIPSRFQARRVATIRLNETRGWQATAEITVSYRFLLLEPGDWITFNHPALGTRTYRIMARTRNAERTITLSLSEIAAGAYSGITQPVVLTPPAVPAAPARAQTVSGFALSPGLETSGLQKLPSIVATWTPPNDTTITGVVIEYRQQGQTAASSFLSSSPESGVAKITSNILAGTNYEARATIITDPTRVTVWTPYVSVLTAADYVVPEAAGQGAAQLGAELAAISTRINSDALNAVRADALEKSRLSMEALTSYRRDWDEASETATQTNAIAVAVNANTASVVAEQVARATQDSALASSLTAVQARANAGTASGAIKLEAVAAPSGVAARIAAFVQAGGDTQFRRAGWAIDVTEGPPGVFTSRFVVEANQFVVSDNGATPFTVIGGVTYIQNAVIQDAAINTARIENNAVTNIWAAEQFSVVGINYVEAPTVNEEIISVTTNRTPGTAAIIFAYSAGNGNGTQSNQVGAQEIYRRAALQIVEFDGLGNQFPAGGGGATITAPIQWGRQEGASSTVYAYTGFFGSLQKVATDSRSGTVRYVLRKTKQSQFASIIVVEFKR